MKWFSQQWGRREGECFFFLFFFFFFWKGNFYSDKFPAYDRVDDLSQFDYTFCENIFIRYARRRIKKIEAMNLYFFFCRILKIGTSVKIKSCVYSFFGTKFRVNFFFCDFALHNTQRAEFFESVRFLENPNPNSWKIYVLFWRIFWRIDRCNLRLFSSNRNN